LVKVIVSSVAVGLAGAALAYAAETPAVGAPPVAAVAPAIVIYDQPNFQGRTLTLDRATPDLAALKFDDKVASLVINGGNDWVLCENRNYAGRCVRVTVKAENLKMLQIAGRVSSLYPAPAAAPAATPAATPTP
jgi:hypothetical protein